MKIITTISLITLNLAYAGIFGATDVVPHDSAYYTKKVRNTELIYTEKNIPFAKQAAEIENALQPLYEDKFGYVMDEPLHVGLVSQYNQIANGFSTQLPNNRQINYIGGAMMSDYFSSPSWLNTLLYHETAHNYQMNAKDNIVSSSLHSVFRNGTLLFFPWFTIPNILESSFMAEGNAVLNESWHGNGGRLYSGRFKAATLMQAKAGYLTPERVYNNNLYFLYGSHHYTLGGHYHYYIAKEHGIEKVNNYWKEHSKDWYLPLFTNNSMERAIGVDFETTFSAWAKTMEKEAENVIVADGEVIASSQFQSPINADNDEVYFIINESGREKPELIVYDKISGESRHDRDSWKTGKVIKTDPNTYMTQASGMTNPWRIWIGLYDDEGFLLDSSKSKVVEGYLSDGRTVYFDVALSYDQPQLFVGNEFYAQVNSSVLIDKDDNLYYFKQDEHKTRTLYKNKKPLVSLESFYSYVSGVDSKGGVYFIANSEYGSSLYRYADGKLSRASSADTIIDARLIDDEHALITSMGSDEFSYQKIALESIDEAPFTVKLFVEDLPEYRAADIRKHHSEIPEIDTQESYYSFLAMNYSGTQFMIASDSEAGLTFDIQANFADPLNQNQLSAFVSRFVDEYTIGGMSYTNNQYFLQYSVSGYGVIDRPEANATAPIDDDERDYGVVATATLPFLKKGYFSASLAGSYYQDYESNSRTPLSLTLPIHRAEHFGKSMYINSLYSVTPYASSDRDDFTYGGSARFEHDLPWEFYIGLGAQYSKSDAEPENLDNSDSRGVKITQVAAFDADPTAIVMPGLIDSVYAKSVLKANAEIRKVFNAAAYFFTFPMSLQRESIFAGYNYYALEDFNTPDEYTDINEAYAGITFSTVLIHRLEIPISFKYIYNDNEAIAEEHSFRVNAGIEF